MGGEEEEGGPPWSGAVPAPGLRGGGEEAACELEGGVWVWGTTSGPGEQGEGGRGREGGEGEKGGREQETIFNINAVNCNSVLRVT